jgi:hypothetical protein
MISRNHQREDVLHNLAKRKGMTENMLVTAKRQIADHKAGTEKLEPAVRYMEESKIGRFVPTNVSCIHFSLTQKHHESIDLQEYDRIEKRIEILTRKLLQMRDVDDMVRPPQANTFFVPDVVHY